MSTFWNVCYRVTSYIRSSLWIIPIVAVLLQQFLGRLLQAFDTQLGLTFLGFGIEGAKALFNAVITFTLSFIVFTFGSLLIAIQVSSGQRARPIDGQPNAIPLCGKNSITSIR